MRAYIEILGAVANRRHELSKADLCFIGEFTRENVLAWMERQPGTDWVGTLPVEDFHAVCGDIDIPWATEEARRSFEPVRLHLNELMNQLRNQLR